MFCRKHTICLVSLKYREIVTLKIVTLYNTLQLFFIDSLKNKKKKLAINSFFYVSQDIWLRNSIQSRFYIFSHPPEFKNV